MQNPNTLHNYEGKILYITMVKLPFKGLNAYPSRKGDKLF